MKCQFSIAESFEAIYLNKAEDSSLDFLYSLEDNKQKFETVIDILNKVRL